MPTRKVKEGQAVTHAASRDGPPNGTLGDVQKKRIWPGRLKNGRGALLGQPQQAGVSGKPPRTTGHRQEPSPTLCFPAIGIPTLLP